MDRTKENWKQVQLGDILDKKQIGQVFKFIKKNEWDELRKYLNENKEELESRGVLPDYLYYWLLNKFGGGYG